MFIMSENLIYLKLNIHIEGFCPNRSVKKLCYLTIATAGESNRSVTGRMVKYDTLVIRYSIVTVDTPINIDLGRLRDGFWISSVHNARLLLFD